MSIIGTACNEYSCDILMSCCLSASNSIPLTALGSEGYSLSKVVKR